MEKPKAESPGLTFIKAASAAMPKSMGDREYICAMDDVMRVAVKNRIQFASTDGAALSRYGHKTCVGIFRPLGEGWYAMACVAGGTYPAMWEKHHKMRPWKAPFVVHRTSRGDSDGLEVLENNRVCAGMGVVIPMSMEEDPECQLDRFDNYPLDGWNNRDGRVLSGQTWWVTSTEVDYIVLCRYQPLTRTPIRRKKISRAAWEQLVSN